MTRREGEDQEPIDEVYRTIKRGTRKTSISKKDDIQPFKVTAVPDTGCTASLISAKLARDMNLIIRPTNSTLSTCSGRK